MVRNKRYTLGVGTIMMRCSRENTLPTIIFAVLKSSSISICSHNSLSHNKPFGVIYIYDKNIIRMHTKPQSFGIIYNLGKTKLLLEHTSYYLHEGSSLSSIFILSLSTMTKNTSSFNRMAYVLCVCATKHYGINEQKKSFDTHCITKEVGS